MSTASTVTIDMLNNAAAARLRRHRAIARLGLLNFTTRMYAGYQPAAHHAEIATALEQISDGEGERLLITMPPRHGKSTLASEHFPPWYLGKHPDDRIIACSHTQRLANTFSRRARNLIDRIEYPFADVKVASDLGSIQTWDIQDRRGGYVAAGIGGPITGLGANVLLIDDPVKSAEEADSETYRNSAWEWFTGTALPRLEPGGSVVVIGTRWHQDDLIGRLIAAGGWTLLHLPALADDGTALWPERFPVDALARIKHEVGSRNWEAQYQGRPSPAEGGTFKRDWWRYYREVPSNLTDETQSWDMSFKETKTGSYVVGQVWAKRGADCYLLDQVRFRGDFPAAVQAVRSLTAKWPKAKAKLVENKANGPAIVATLKREIAGLIEVEPEGGKEARANAVSPLVESGNVFLPDPTIAPWVHDFVEECAAFPNGANDDQVDCLSQALVRMQATRADRRLRSVPW